MEGTTIKLRTSLTSFLQSITSTSSQEESDSILSNYYTDQLYLPLIPTHSLTTLLNPTTPSNLLETLVQLALEPPLTRQIFRHFSSVKEHFWATWLEGIGFDKEKGGWNVPANEMDVDREGDEKSQIVTKVFRAMVAVLGVHSEVIPFLTLLLTHPSVSLLPTIDSPSLLTLSTLLTYLPSLPHHLSLCLYPALIPTIEKTFQTHPSTAYRHLAWRIYKSWHGLHGPFGESLKEKWVTRVVGTEREGMDYVPWPEYERDYKVEMEGLFGKQESEEHLLMETEWWEVEGGGREVEGGMEVRVRKRDVDVWCLPMTEGYRDYEERTRVEELKNTNSIVDLEEDGLAVKAEDLSSLIVAIPSSSTPILLFIEGYLTPSPSSPSPSPSSFIPTPPSLSLLSQLATSLLTRVPTLLTSPPSSGKLTLLTHFYSLLHPLQPPSKLVLINLSDRSLDSKSLLGSLSSNISPDAAPGTFCFVEGSLTKAVREGRWVVLLGIEGASMEVLSVIKSLSERMWIASRPGVEGRGKGMGGEKSGGVGVKAGGKWVQAKEGFMLFATRSVAFGDEATPPKATFLSRGFWNELVMRQPSKEEVRMIVAGSFGRIEKSGFGEVLVRVWEEVVECVSVGEGNSRAVELRDLLRWCRRVNQLLPPHSLSSIASNPLLQEEIFLEARDVFLAASPSVTTSKYGEVVEIFARGLELGKERVDWLVGKRTPELVVPKRVDEGDGKESKVKEGILRMGRVSLPYRFPSSSQLAKRATSRPYALTKPSLQVLEKLSVCLLLSEPVLMVGETGTGKTAAVGHLAQLMGKELVALNLSNQTEAGDLVGGFKPVDESEEARRSASELVNRFVDLFGRTFSLSRNADYVTHVRKAFDKKKWSRLVSLWREANRMAVDKISSTPVPAQDGAETPRKKRKVDVVLSKDLPELWKGFVTAVGDFELRHVHKAGKSKFMFAFVEGPLAKAIRNGDWVLLDEVNLAAPETLEALSTLLQTPDSSIVLTEQGDLEPIPRHPEFRLFACMNPATDVGKRDLPPALRSKFSEIWVPPPDEDKDALVTIVQGYISHVVVQDRAAILDVAELYSAIKALAIGAQLADGSNSPPHFSMRTLARALTFTSEFASIFGLRRALFEGFVMAFTMLLDPKSGALVRTLLEQHIVARAKNRGTLFSQVPPKPSAFADAIRFGPYWLETGPEPLEEPKNYILTPSVQAKVLDLARAVLTRKVPVLIQGPTSAGKTSVVEYLAKRTGHRFVRINNHEHTDIQEYIGTYVSDPDSGKLIFQEGVLVRALRRGDWIVLDELNLAPTDVLEALNRLLDDNRELVIPETGEVVKPHPHFMLFATQNPPGLYGGRKVLSRAFRNRFLEMHFGDVPQDELETILCERCEIAPSYAKKTVAVFVELQRRRQAGRVFEKHAFATLRDLFRWGGRGSVGYQQLAEDGYMLLAERARRPDDKAVVKDVIETEMKVKIDETTLYDFANLATVGLPVPPPVTNLVWTGAMRRLYFLIAAALHRNEPVLLVGETGSGKTSVCQSLALALNCELHILGCHQNTETADLLGGQRPLRNRTALQAGLREEALQLVGAEAAADSFDDLIEAVEALATTGAQAGAQELVSRMRKTTALFEWHDGPLVQAMTGGDLVLLDEISLADDSVLERLNSVLEPSRTLVLAEKGGQDLDDIQVIGATGFQILATMNPGGDFGKKELSPALRNRFTEIWVPAVSDEEDLLQIIGSRWRDVALESYGRKIVDFGRWFGKAATGTEGLGIGLRDILAWVDFLNVAFDRFSVSDQAIQIDNTSGSNGVTDSSSSSSPALPLPDAFCQGALMTVVDGLGALPTTSGLSHDALSCLRAACWTKLESLVKVSAPLSNATFPVVDTPSTLYVGMFGVAKGNLPPTTVDFSLRAPTTRLNANRLLRALQLPKPVLLEGSPGVGKTSLVTAVAAATGHALVRINLSDQTDLMDLLGSDLPVEGGKSGEFAWKDAPFLAAMQEGAWVLLDEMNLASQAVLEGLNSCLDHRGTVYIPELDRTFSRHPDFRIFAAQNPLGQGGGRKGLPRSFLDRFSIVHMEELNSDDLHAIASALYPDVDPVVLGKMIAFNSSIHRHTMELRTFGAEGSPWEFNLRDVLRWLSLLRSSTGLDPHRGDPVEYFGLLYLQRFRNSQDRSLAAKLYSEAFQTPLDPQIRPWPTLSPRYAQIGHSMVPRGEAAHRSSYAPLLQGSLQPLEALAKCLEMGWLAILTGPHASGKTTLARQVGDLGGRDLDEFAMNAEVDTLELLGSFEQADQYLPLDTVISDLKGLLARVLSRGALHSGSSVDVHSAALALDRLQRPSTSSPPHGDTLESLQHALSVVIDLCAEVIPGELLQDLRRRLDSAIATAGTSSAARFEWIDGPLVSAMKTGGWLLIEDANLCSPSVLDRLNSLFEPGGRLQLAERGPVNGEIQIIVPHPDFRLIMTLDPRSGELSRAMRNRGIEIALLPSPAPSQASLDQSHNAQPDLAFADPTLASLAGLISATSSTSSSVTHSRHLAATTPSSQYALALRSSRAIRHGSTAELDYVLRKISRHSLLAQVSSERLAVAASREVPFNLFTLQPSDLSLSPLFATERSLASSTRLFSQALDTLACVATSSPSHPATLQVTLSKSLKSLFVWEKSLLSRTGRLASEDANADMSHLVPLREALDSLVEKLVTVPSGANQEYVSDTLSCAQHLQALAFELEQVCQTVEADFSSIQYVAAWIGEALEQLPANLAQIASPVSLCLAPVKRSLLLTSGKEMTVIWRAWLPYQPTESVAAAAHSRLSAKGKELTGVWSSAVLDLFLDVAVTLGVPPVTPLSVEQGRDATEVVDRLLLLKANAQPSEALDETVQAASRANMAGFLIAELGDVSSALGSLDHQYESSLIQVAQRGGGVPMGCIVPLHQLASSPRDSTWRGAVEFQVLALWAQHSATSGLSLQTDLSSSAADLVRPFLLRVVTALTAVDKSTLGNLPVTAESLQRAACVQALVASGDLTPRTEALKAVLTGCVRLLVVSTGGTLGNDVSSSNIWSTLFDATPNFPPAVAETITKYFTPFASDLQSKEVSLSVTGEGFVAFSRTLWTLYVPNIPLDPAIGLRARSTFLNRQLELLNELSQTTRDAEWQLTGNSTNGKIRIIGESLASLEDEARNAGDVPVTRDGNAVLLSTLFRELRSFQDQILSDVQLNSLLRDLRGPWTSPIAGREANLQSSIETLLQRLALAYGELEDIIAPIRLSLCCLKIGLALLAHSAKSLATPGSAAHYGPFLQKLTAFPSVAHSAAIEATDLPLSIKIGDSPLPPAEATLIQLASLTTRLVVLESRLDHASLQRLTQLYDRMHYLWAADRRHEEAEARAAESLYRSKADVQQIASDEEQEAAEFAKLFPTYEDPDTVEMDSPTTPPISSPRLLQPSHQATLANLHRALFGHRTPAERDMAQQTLTKSRSIAVTSLVNDIYESLTADVDQSAAAYRVRALVEAARTKTPDAVAPVDRDFYNEADIQETAKAVPILQQLVRRLSDLIEVWPDQMVLHNLRERCETILALSSSSSIAKVLTAIEQLLQHTEDWESYASREHSLVINRSAITSLIVEWRRLELTCWSKLLLSVRAHFSDPVAEWWFRFYETTIRGAPGVDDDPENTTSQVPEDYYRDLVALLDSFMTSSSIGQYSTRLETILSFATFADQLGQPGPEEMNGASSLRRVSDIMFNVYAFYNQFVPRVSQYLEVEVGRVEKEVRDLIKLASWKDVNVYALRQSAIRSHHQLYKSVRKLRAVLQKPSSDFFVLLDAEKPEVPSPPDAPVAVELALQSALPGLPESCSPTPSHILKLTQTYERLSSLTASRLEPFMTFDCASPVDDFAVLIITTAHALKEESKAGPEEGREQRVKSLATRKRRALGELLKELKRLGLSTPAPAILDTLRNPGTIYSLPASHLLLSNTLLSSGSLRHLVEKTDSYHFRLLSDLPSLRSCPASHHEDISTRDVQRAIGAIEKCVSNTFDNRALLMDSLTSYIHLDAITERLTVAEGLGTAQPMPTAGILATDLHVNVVQVGRALQETLEACDIHRSATANVDAEHAALRSAVAEARTLLSGDEGRLSAIISASALDPIWSTSADIKVFTSAREHLLSTVSLFNEPAPPSLHYLINPLKAWLSSLIIPEFFSSAISSSATLDALSSSHRSLIDFVLVVIQELAKLEVRETSLPPPSEALGDHAIKTRTKLLQEILQALRLPELVRQTQSFLQLTHIASRAHSELVGILIRRVTPFIRLAITLAQRHFVSFFEWQKASLKLAFVLTSVIRQISTEGYCRPAVDDGKEGDAADGKTMDGTGMADGQGATNVSKDIEDESQVEGLQGDVENQEKKDEGEKDGDDDAVEMSMDFEGDMEDRGDGDKEGDESDDESDSESQPDPEEQVADVDPLDPSSVDEKFWGDEQSKDTDKSNEEVNQETSKPAGESGMGAKDDSAPAPQPKGEGKEAIEEEKDGAAPPDDAGDAEKEEGQEGDEEQETGEEEEEGDESPQKNDGERLDERMPEADNLDLPDDLQLDVGDQKDDELDLGSDMESMAGDDEITREDDFDANRGEEESPEDNMEADDDDGLQGENPDPAETEGPEVDDSAPPDESMGGNEVGETGGDGNDDNSSAAQPVPSDPTSGQEGAQSQLQPQASEEAMAQKEQDSTGMDDPDPLPDDTADPTQTAPSNAADGVSKQRSSDSDPSSDPSQRRQNEKTSSAQPQRSLGDALQSWRRRLEEISDLADSEIPTDNAEASHVGDKNEVEYVPDADAIEMDDQALGPATEEQVQGLEKLRLGEEEEVPTGFEADEMDVDDAVPATAPIPSSTLDLGSASSMVESDLKAIAAADLQADAQQAADQKEREDNLRLHEDDKSSGNPAAPPSPEENEEVEQAMLQWRSGDDESLTADGVWRLYESLTRDLSYALTEQLRLILEPTLATRLKGDYRSGKRLNMKKIIPYIASEFTKDKIWLRRTRPSQREYQILIAIDDSKSMADSHSVHLAYQTLALISRSLARLEVGGVSICRFGQAMQVLHPFEGGPISDEAGAKLISQFTFAQGTTDVRLLVEKSLAYLSLAKEQAQAGKSSAAAADLWQLQIIISDGLCQDHEKLRALLRKANEMKVVFVFVVLDSLHKRTDADLDAPDASSILAMKSVAYTNGTLKMTRYLDSFPFEYFIVLRDVEALPEVLSSALRQFFEKVSSEH